MNTPVIFIIFNRPRCTKKLFQAIRAAQPPLLLLVADGPRENHPEDISLCPGVRQMVTENIDWPCQLLCCFSEKNLGRDARIISGISWAFQHVEKAIILEDDCLPDASFFIYCEQLLDKYFHNPQIMSICGSNCLANDHSPYSYSFSRIPLVWGWATWRRAWELYTTQLSDQAIHVIEKNLEEEFREWPTVVSYGKKTLENCKKEKSLSWDYFWAFVVLSHQSFHIFPSLNLIKNIGFSQDATYTRHTSSPLAQTLSFALSFPLRPPEEIAALPHIDKEILTLFIQHIQMNNAL